MLPKELCILRQRPHGIIDQKLQCVGMLPALAHQRDQFTMRRLGTPEEVAQSVLHLAVSEYITGQVLTVDGGFLF